MEWNFKADLPIYSQLVQQIKAAMEEQTIGLQELEREGMVYSQRTSGRFVTEDVKVIENAKKMLAEEQIRSFLASMTKLGYPREEIISLLQASIKEEKNDANIGM